MEQKRAQKLLERAKNAQNGEWALELCDRVIGADGVPGVAGAWGAAFGVALLHALAPASMAASAMEGAALKKKCGVDRRLIEAPEKDGLRRR